MLKNVQMLGGKEIEPEAYVKYVEDSTDEPTPQVGVFQHAIRSCGNSSSTC
jgi:hypothetical protein